MGSTTQVCKGPGTGRKFSDEKNGLTL
jgi:hypothetical protein